MSDRVASFGLSAAQVIALQSVFARHAVVSRVVIYGSRAQGLQKHASDIDLTLHGAALTARDLLKISAEIDDLDMPYQVDLSLFSDIDDAGLRDHIARVGQTFYEMATRQRAA